jgi:hypothetical protein
MNYKEIRTKIKSGDLVALTHENWNSLYDLQIQAVRIFTESEYSHVAIAWVVGGRVFLIEAVTPKVRIFPLSNLQDTGFYWIPTDTPMSDAELEFGLKRVGIGEYSKIEAVEAQFNMLNVGSNDKWECSELVIAMRKLSGLHLGDKATPSAVVQSALEQGMVLNYIKM